MWTLICFSAFCMLFVEMPLVCMCLLGVIANKYQRLDSFNVINFFCNSGHSEALRTRCWRVWFLLAPLLGLQDAAFSPNLCCRLSSVCPDLLVLRGHPQSDQSRTHPNGFSLTSHPPFKGPTSTTVTLPVLKVSGFLQSPINFWLLICSAVCLTLC